MPANKDDITIFGQTNYRNQLRPFGIKRDDRRRHMYIIGKTGMGKTTLLENLIISDIINGEGCCYIDPHGDTAEKILDFIPTHRINDVVYMNPADTAFPIAFNILESVEETHKHLIASGIVSVFKKQFAESWGPRLEYILRNTVMALLDYPGSTLLGVMRILVEKEYREKVVEKIKDPVVKSFWVNEYTKWNDRVLQEVISPIQNKVGQFLSNFLIRNIVGQVKSTIDLREIMDNQKILILNLSKGRIGEDTMQLLGSMIVTKLYMAAMSRVEIPEKDRKDFYLYVDEFQNFATDSFGDILSEARKYRLDLIVAHQYIEQLPETVQAAVFGNVGTLICFRTGAADAERLALEFAPFFTEEDLVNLPAFAIYLKLMIDGVSSDPFSADTLPPLFGEYRTDSGAKVIQVSRERYANPRAVVEDKINRWSGMDLSGMMGAMSGGSDKDYEMGEIVLSKDIVTGPTVSLSSLGQGTLTSKPRFNDRAKREERTGREEVRRETRSESSRKPRANESDGRPMMPRVPGSVSQAGMFDASCALCHKNFKLKFQPEPGRPAYCDDCFKKVREDRRKKPSDRSPRLADTGENIIKKDILQAKPISLASLLPTPRPSAGQENPPADDVLDELESIKSDK